MKRLAVLGLVVLHASAWAESTEPQPPRYRAGISLGAAARISNQTGDLLPLHVGGFSPWVFEVNGAFFFARFLGAGADFSFENYHITGTDLYDRNVHLPMGGYRGRVYAAGRWSPQSWVGLELHAGWGIGAWPAVILADGMGSQAGLTVVTPYQVSWTGPHLGAVLSLENDGPIGAQFFATAELGLIPDKLFSSPPFNVAAGLELFFGKLQLGGIAASILLRTEAIGVVSGENDLGRSLRQFQFRVTLGARFRQQNPPVEGGVIEPVKKTGNGILRGRVVTAGIGLSGATVLAGVLAATKSGPDGVFEVLDVPPGRYTVKALLEGYKPAEQTIDVPPGDVASVTLSISKPSGPGTIRGVVKNDKGEPVADADVALEGKPPVKSGADGAYVLEQAGPGPVKVKVTAKGFKDAEDAAQVPPEGQATLDFALVKAGEKQMATIRGLVKAASGKAVKGTVKVSDVNLTIPVKGDGRFVVQVPGGKYTLTVEAAGYVTQVKTVEVADGDQAIFHVDLQPAGR